MAQERRVVMRDEQAVGSRRSLVAYVDDSGALHVDGQDLGSGTSMVSSDGEYEWFETVAADAVPHLVELLGGGPGEDVLDLIERRFTGPGSHEFERVLEESEIPVTRSVWSG
jgi:hypothetical protein